MKGRDRAQHTSSWSVLLFGVISLLVVSITVSFGMEIASEMTGRLGPELKESAEHTTGPPSLPLAEWAISLAVLVGVCGLWPLVEFLRYKKEHPLMTFALIHYTKDKRIHSRNVDLTPCVECEWIVETNGVIREYHKELILFGIPVTLEQGENRYCGACRDDYVHANHQWGEPMQP